MNERATNPQIDDVLASIRRLVADELSESPTISVPLVRHLRQASPRLVLSPEARIEAAPAAPLRLLAPLPLEAPFVEAEPPEPLVETPDTAPEVSTEAARRLASLETLFAAQKLRDGFEAEEGEAPPAVFPLDPPEAPFIEAEAPEPQQITWTEPAIEAPRGDMHEIIRDVLREELQGVMGERITRSLRKMVRAEVARALALRDAKVD